MNRFQAAWSKLAGKGVSEREKEQGGQLEKSDQQRRGSADDEDNATERAAAKVASAAGVELDDTEKEKAGAFVHYAFGGALGAAYGASVELIPSLNAGGGVPFGIAVWLAADEIGTPLAGLAKPPTEYPLSVHGQSLASHMVFGAVTELVRRLMRER